MKIFSFALVLSLLFLISCTGSKPTEPSTVADSSSALVEPIHIDTFSTFPPEMDDCGCDFAADTTSFQKSAFIFMTDNSSLAFMKINGELLKFENVQYKQLDSLNSSLNAFSKNYNVRLDLHKGKIAGEESEDKYGTLQLNDHNGNAVIRSIYGECGC